MFASLDCRYLCEEWKERHNGTEADASSKFLSLRFVPLEVLRAPNLNAIMPCGLLLVWMLQTTILRLCLRLLTQ